MGPIKKQELVDWDDLAVRAKQGDWRAEDELFKKSKARLWAVYRNRNWQWKLPEDYAESIMHFAIARTIQKYHEGIRYSAYMVTVFINKVKDEWLRPANAEDIGIEDLKNEPVSDFDLEQESISSEEKSALLECLKGLLPERRLALQLMLEGYKNREISRFIPDRDIDDLIYHAKQDLRLCLESRLRKKY